MASNSKALITVLFLFLLSTQSILPSKERKILGTNEYGSGDTISAAKNMQSQLTTDYDPGYMTEEHDKGEP